MFWLVALPIAYEIDTRTKLNAEQMANKFDYQNMLNRIKTIKIDDHKTTPYTEEEAKAWNNAVEVCFKLVERRRGKFETKDSNLPKHLVSKCQCIEHGIDDTTMKCVNCGRDYIE